MTGLTELVARRGAAGGRASGAPERRAVRLVQALLLLESAMYSALAPVLPHYERLLHAAKPAMGILNASYPAGLVPGSFLAAWAAARLGVRRATLLGLVLFAAAIAPFGWATGEVALDALRFAQGLACGFIWIGGLTWVIGVAERERRGEVLGTVFAAAIFGTLVGPILGTLAIAAGTGPVFAAVALASLALARWTASHPQPPLGAERERSPRLRAMLANRRISLGGWLILLEAGTVGAVSTLVPLRLAALGAAEALIGATFLIAALLSTQMSRPIGRITDRHGPRRPLRAGLIATAVLMVLLTLPRSATLLAVVTIVVFGAPLTAYTIPAMAIMTDAAESAGIPIVVATMVLNLAWALGEAVGAPAAAGLAQSAGDSAPLLGLAAIMLATLAPVARARMPVPAALGGPRASEEAGEAGAGDSDEGSAVRAAARRAAAPQPAGAGARTWTRDQ